jgi:hypothetical protein
MTPSKAWILNLMVPIGKADANREVAVIIEPVGPSPLTQEAWRQFVLETAGAWQGELERPEQGEYPRREELP